MHLLLSECGGRFGGREIERRQGHCAYSFSCEIQGTSYFDLDEEVYYQIFFDEAFSK